MFKYCHHLTTKGLLKSILMDLRLKKEVNIIMKLSLGAIATMSICSLVFVFNELDHFAFAQNSNYSDTSTSFARAPATSITSVGTNIS